MFNYNTKQSFFVLICESEDFELQKIERFLHLLSNSGVGDIVNECLKQPEFASCTLKLYKL